MVFFVKHRGVLLDDYEGSPTTLQVGDELCFERQGDGLFLTILRSGSSDDLEGAKVYLAFIGRRPGCGEKLVIINEHEYPTEKKITSLAAFMAILVGADIRPNDTGRSDYLSFTLIPRS